MTAYLREDHTVDFTGVATFSRLIRLGWYAIGVRFSPPTDERLIPSERPGQIHSVELE